MVLVTSDNNVISFEAKDKNGMEYISSVRLKEDGTDASRLGEALLKLVEKTKQ